MATDLRGHTVPGPLETPRRAALTDLSLSIRDIVYVANATARAQLVTDLTTAGHGPSTSNPLYVHRGDAASGRELEVTTDGTTWRAVVGDDSGWQPLATFGTVGGSTNTTWRTRRIGPAVHVKGILRPNSGTIPQGQSTSVGVVASGHRPAETVHLLADGFIAGSTVEHLPRAVVSVAPSGNMSVWAELALSWVQMPATTYLVD